MQKHKQKKGGKTVSSLKTLSLLLAAIISLSQGVAMAADYKLNPFTLAYEGAITENVKGKVNIHPVTYKLNGIGISANVYTPANYNPGNKYPAVVVAHAEGAELHYPFCQNREISRFMALPKVLIASTFPASSHLSALHGSRSTRNFAYEDSCSHNQTSRKSLRFSQRAQRALANGRERAREY